jgi:hypothetical protein
LKVFYGIAIAALHYVPHQLFKLPVAVSQTQKGRSYLE